MLFATIPGPMALIGSPVPTLDQVYGMALNPLTGGLYAGFPSSLDAQMWTTSAGGALPVDKGQVAFG